MYSKMATTFTLDTSEKTLEHLQTITTKNITIADSNTNYVILNYDTSMVANNDTVRGSYNAVIMNPDTRRILAIGPPQSITLDKFKSLYGNTIYNTNTLQVSELVEGVFIQFFYDTRTEQWEISTRNSIGGHYLYYRNPDKDSKTYRTLLYEAIGLTDENRPLDQWDALKDFNTNYCYHFILQHPENHMVQNHEIPKLYMIGAFELHFNDVENQVRFVPSKEYKSVFECYDSISFPTVFPIDKNQTNSYDKVAEELITTNTPASLMGIVIQQEQTGDRYIHINTNYETLQKLRGTHPNLLYNYLCLKKIHKLEEFLSHFPQYKSMFWRFHELLEVFITKLHQCYVDYFIQKNKQQIEKKLFYHIQQMHHTIYIPSLQQQEKIIIRKSIVRRYLQDLEPGHLFHLLITKS